VYPVPKAEGTDYQAGKAWASYAGPAAAPGVVVQPEGRGFHIDGHFVRYSLKLAFLNHPTCRENATLLFVLTDQRKKIRRC
jgi:hypothetical protein